MTNKKASVIIGNIPVYGDECYSIAEYQEAKTIAVQALSQEPCDDAISRQAVRHILNHEVKMPIKVWKKLFELVDCLPPVNPTSNVSIQITEREKYGRFN